MPPASCLTDETERVEVLRAADARDLDATEVLNSLVRVAMSLFGVPGASVALIDAAGQWSWAAIVLPQASSVQNSLFCTQAILNPDTILCIPDASRDGRFADHPLIAGQTGLRFYAGAPVFGLGPNPIGTLNVQGPTPLTPDPAALARLKDLAQGVSATIRLHSLERQAQRKAQRDPLTGLPNCREFEDALAARMPDGVTLFLLDLDNFKATNDLFGHPGGNLALCEAAHRLTAAAGADAQVFRLSGDEFAVLSPRTASHEKRAELATRFHASLQHPFLIDGQPVPIRASIGAATLPDDTGIPASLIHLADVALYKAKHAGRGVTMEAEPIPPEAGPRLSHSFGPRPRDPAGIGRIGLTQRLRDALVPSGQEPFTLAFQPVISLATGDTVSLEALVRWQLGPTTTVPPVEFVTLAERIGLVSQLDCWVLLEACRCAASWPQPWPVSVNISNASFGLADVPGMVERALAATGLPPDRLILEMTETALAGDLGHAQRAVIALRALGVGVALDDFGAGHGTLTMLRQFPFTELKLDRNLIEGVSTLPAHEHMVDMVAKLGLSLGIPVVAEGIETAEMLRTMSRLGVIMVQGYYLSRPVPHAQVPQAVAKARQIMLETQATPVAAIAAPAAA